MATAVALAGGDAMTLAWAALGTSAALLVSGIVVLSMAAKANLVSMLVAVARPVASAAIVRRRGDGAR